VLFSSQVCSIIFQFGERAIIEYITTSLLTFKVFLSRFNFVMFISLLSIIGVSARTGIEPKVREKQSFVSADFVKLFILRCR